MFSVRFYLSRVYLLGYDTPAILHIDPFDSDLFEADDLSR